MSSALSANSFVIIDCQPSGVHLHKQPAGVVQCLWLKTKSGDEWFIMQVKQ